MHKKVLYVTTDTEFGGGQQYILQLAEGLKDAGLQWMMGLPEHTPVVDRIRAYPDITILPYPVRHRLDFRAMKHFAQSIREEHIDLILLGDSKGWNMSRIVRDIAGIQSRVAVIHMTHIGLEQKNPYPWYERKLSALWDRWWAQGCTKILTSNNKNFNILVEEGVPADKIRTIPNGIDQALLQKDYSGAAQHVRQRHGWDEDRVVFGMLARLGPGKDYQLIFRAIDRICSDNAHAHFVFVGTGPLLESFQQHITAMGLSDRITFTGWVEDAFEYIHAFDVFLFSSISEGIPYGILEAMAFRKPILSTNNGGISEVIHHGRTGRLVPPGNTDAFVDGIQWMIDHPDQWKNMGDAAYTLVTEQYTTQHMVNKFKTLLTDEHILEN